MKMRGKRFLAYFTGLPRSVGVTVFGNALKTFSRASSITVPLCLLACVKRRLFIFVPDFSRKKHFPDLFALFRWRNFETFVEPCKSNNIISIINIH